MQILDEGHKYLLDDNKSESNTNILTFFKDSEINVSGYAGTTNQEVIRALINRVQYLEKQLPNEVNKDIIKHLRIALILHEKRHLDRLIDKDLPVEKLEVFKDGHIVRLNQ